MRLSLLLMPASWSIRTTPEEIAKGILRVLTEQGLREQLSAKALERAREFSWKTAKEIEVYHGTNRAKSM
jgi:glycosyltransferase involved in cell wall biosynthesis